MSRWIIVSNRLPFTVDKKTQKLKQSSGGLVTAINGIKSNTPICWVGSLAPGITPSQVKEYEKRSRYSFSSPKVEAELYENYYNGFCNDVLWPILHYETTLIKFNAQRFEDYKNVNRCFAKHLAKIVKKDDIIWVNDFHLFLLPKYLKEIKPNIKIGFFLHIPFPSSEVYRELPCRKEILEAVLYSDLIGFHDFSYLRHFASSVYNILGYESSLMDIKTPSQTTKLGVFPVSIDTADFVKKSLSQQTKKMTAKYHLENKRLKTILGVERLDYTKGIPQKLRAFKKFLEDFPEYIGKVELMQIAVPSRTNVPEYIQLRGEVEKLVSEINGKFSHLNYVPVKYIFDSVTVHELMALYRNSEILLVTSKRDGMNLVCLEYLVAQNQSDPGIVILSEFTGAASTLSHATIINPMDIKGTADKIYQSLKTPLKDRKENHKVMYDFLKNYTATVWAESFISHLQGQTATQQLGMKNILLPEVLKPLKNKLKHKKKVFLLDFDGTLAAIQESPEDVTLPLTTRKLIQQILEKPNSECVIVTGRDKKFIQKQFKGMNIAIACEHGASFFDPKLKKWRSLAASKQKRWFKTALDVLDQYQKRTPRSFVEKKVHAICWHYRRSPKDFAEFQARKLLIDLEATLSHEPVTVSQGKKIVEVKSLEANKGYFTEWYLSRYASPDDVLIAIGDDRTDEDMFKAVQGRGHSIKVGKSSQSHAQYYVEEQSQVWELIKQLT